jgi:hypothetical protein
MSVTAPSADTAGKVLDSQIVTVQAIVTANASPTAQPAFTQSLNQLQVQAVDHYMVTGWLNAAAILATYSAPAGDAIAQALSARVAALQSSYSNAPAMPPGNADGYGSSGWTTIAANYAQQLYQAQIQLVERLMDIGQPTAATILSTLTGVQTAPAGITFEYAFTGVGFSDSWIEG